MLKAIIFDLNGVFIQSQKLSERFKEKFGVSEEIFVSALKVVMDKARLPNAGNSFLLWQPFLNEWKMSLTQEEFFDFWFKAETEVTSMVQLAKEIKAKGIKIFILSNNFSERANFYEKNFSFLKEFDGLYYSWQTGFVKPDKQAYENILEKEGLKVEECLYFDDSEKNIETANGLGIEAHIFSEESQIRKILQDKGIL